MPEHSLLHGSWVVSFFDVSACLFLNCGPQKKKEIYFCDLADCWQKCVCSSNGEEGVIVSNRSLSFIS